MSPFLLESDLYHCNSEGMFFFFFYGSLQGKHSILGHAALLHNAENMKKKTHFGLLFCSFVSPSNHECIKQECGKVEPTFFFFACISFRFLDLCIDAASFLLSFSLSLFKTAEWDV